MGGYEVRMFTSDDLNDIEFSLESSKLNTTQLSEFDLIKSMKLMIGGDEHLADLTYTLPVLPEWKKNFILYLRKWSVYIPKLNEIASFISKLEDGRYLAISFNDSLDHLEKKKVLFEMQEREGGLSAQKRYEEYLLENELWLNVYKPLSYSYKYRIRFGPQDRKQRKCRYCGKRMPETCFKKDSHTISKSLGNIRFFTNDECDGCNELFGKEIEQEFINYVSIYRTLAAKYDKQSFYTTKTDVYRLEVDKDTFEIDFKVLEKSKVKVVQYDDKISLIADGGFINYHKVYRGLVKYVIGMLPNEELQYFKETIRWVNGVFNIKYLPNVKQTVYNVPVQHPFINMFFRKQKSQVYPYLIAEFHVNHLEFVYVIPGCSLDKYEMGNDIVDEFLKLRKDNNRWHNLNMSIQQPVHMNLKVNYYFKRNENT